MFFYIRHLNRHTSDLPHRDLAIGDLLYRPLSRHTKSPLGRRSVYSFVYTPIFLHLIQLKTLDLKTKLKSLLMFGTFSGLFPEGW